MKKTTIRLQLNLRVSLPSGFGIGNVCLLLGALLAGVGYGLAFLMEIFLRVP